MKNRLDGDKVRQLFEKYLNNQCSEEEKALMFAYFDNASNERQIRSLIQEEFHRNMPVPNESDLVLEEVLKDIEGVVNPRPKGSLRSTPFFVRTGMAAAIVGIIVSLTLLFYLLKPGSSFFNSTVTVSTVFGEKKKIELEDGSVIWINASSKLTYPRHFSQSFREVELEGEAFFDVRTNPEKPFIVRSGQLQTTVLGTSFNVKAYQEDKTASVSVVSGKVKVASSEAELYLEPSQQAILDKKGERLNKKTAVVASEIVSWKEGLLHFRNTTFSEVTTVLKRTTGVDIAYEPHLEKCAIIHADFRDGEPLEAILEALMLPVEGRVEKNKKGGYLLTSPIRCDQ